MRSGIYLLCVSALLLTACSGGSGNKNDDTIDIVCTTGMIRDMVENIAGNKATVTGLMGPGVDPHYYKASQGDVKKLGNADIIFYNGLQLEGKMVEILKKMGRTKKVKAIAAVIDSSKLIMFDGAADPHVWFNVSLWRQAGAAVLETLSEHDPSSAAFYRANYERYAQKLDTLHQWVADTIGVIPQEQRVLVTAHDAFSYFGEAYGVEVVGLQGISTVAEFGVNDITRIVDLIVERRIKAIFVESSVSQRSIKAVQQGAQSRGFEVTIGGTLYSDAMGAPGSGADNYIDMVRSNVKTIIGALK